MNKNRLTITLVLLIIFVVVAVDLSRSAVRETAELSSADLQAQVEQSFGQLPLLFVENQGQWDEQVAYAVQGSDKTLYFTAEGVTFALTAPGGEAAEEDGRPDLGPRSLAGKPVRSERWAVKLDFLGANPGVRPVGEAGDSAVISYFKGQPDDWHAGLPTYRRIVYYDLWPGIDLVYEGTVNRLKYHFVVHPGADPNQVRLAYRGASDVSLNDAGQLVVDTPVGSFADDTPVAYQDIEGERVLVDMGYVLEGETAESQPYHFDIGEYDAERPLVLDPAVFVYSGYLGGSGADFPLDIALDESGNAYITGYTNSDETTFPVEVGPDLTFNSGLDAFIIKLNPTGTDLIYAGYIGGSSSDFGRSIKVDELGNAYIAGETLSSESTFPVTIGPDLIYNGGYDAFVAKINPTGDDLIYAGYIGGDDDEGVGELAIDGSGNVYLSGWAESDEATFPVLIGPDLTYNGGNGGDAFVTKINSAGTGLVYSGYIGGSEYDVAFGIAVDESGNAYVAGVTDSSEVTFPVIIGPDLTFNGVYDAFVTKVNSDGTGLIYSGYVGGSQGDSIFGIALDNFGNAYLTGDTASDEGSFPVLGGPDLTFNGYSDGFVAKINGDGTDLIYAGYIGGMNGEIGLGIVVDEIGSVYIVGYTESDESSFPVVSGPDLTFNGGGDDGFVAKLNPNGTDFVYAGFIGGDDTDQAISIAIDDFGNAYVAGITSSDETTFPVIVGPDLTYNGGEDGFITKIALIDAPQVIDIEGSIMGTTEATYAFTATTAPVSTTLPLNYSWQATGQQTITHTNGLTDTAVFTWNITGTKTITVTAWNLGGSITTTHAITISTNNAVYFPAILKP